MFVGIFSQKVRDKPTYTGGFSPRNEIVLIFMFLHALSHSFR